MESILKMEWKYLLNEENGVYEVTNMPTIIREFSINYEMTTPKSCHDVTTPMET